jgi:hypothetical protein
LKQAMRRLSIIIGLLVLLAVPAGAGALKRTPGDGTLAVDNAQGTVVLNLRGGIIGRFDQGTIEVTDPIAGDGPPPVIRGYQQAVRLGPRRVQYSGEGDVRFRLIGGLFRVRISAIGMDVSAVGRGTAMLDGSNFPDQSGRYSLNGGSFLAMPKVPLRLALGQAPPGIVPAK